ncbi:hypothetical protein RHSIM_Rhsim07G0134300 [Rhododendron simsii]|uniref:Uncharacterized protein n=1 Tax=Rhododendron simsii TaxID=118357 RepID=A0A834LK73_RHOSS|nr:hypothetical protein RHSIM_Rhsim07G0134300 [Rhododendron simsii]
MVGIFSRFSVGRNGHRRTQSALQGGREAIPPNSNDTSDATVTGGATAAAHGIEVAIEFKPLEHPPEPLDNDRPIQCPLPEPSILNIYRVVSLRASCGRPEIKVIMVASAVKWLHDTITEYHVVYRITLLPLSFEEEVTVPSDYHFPRVRIHRPKVSGVHLAVVIRTNEDEDGRIWKERASAGGGQRRAEMPVMQEGPRLESGPVGKKPPRPPSNRVILPSISAPEHSLLKLLEECSPSGV